MNFEPEPRVIWSHRERTMLGYGTADVFDPGTGLGRYSRAAKALQDSGKALAFASFTFDPDQEGSVVVIPEEVVPITGRGIPTEGPAPQGFDVVDDGVEAWRRGFRQALEAIESGTVEKVVLARRVELALTSPPHLATVAEQLRLTGMSSYTFVVEGLVGCSPELLVSIRGGRLSSLTLAGTAADVRGLGSEKIKSEHRLAVESVKTGIEAHVRGVEEESEETLVFGAIHHLGTRIGGDVSAGATVTDVLAALHPTAAVAGSPKQAALELIREIEPEPRGRYAGPVGWFRPTGEGEFSLALRCGLVGASRAVLHAGGGIVAGSDTDQELAETEMKLAPMRSALGG